MDAIKKQKVMNASTWNMKMLENLGLISLGCFIAVENFLVILAAIRNKRLRENTHYNLVISLSVSDFFVGLYCILFGSAIAPNYGSDKTAIKILCTAYYCVGCVIYNTSLQQTFSISLNRYLVITENKLSQTLWNGNRKYLAFCVMVAISVIIYVPIFSSSQAECGHQNHTGNKSTPFFFVLGSIHAVFLLLTFVIYFFTLWNIFKLHHKTDFEERDQSDESKERKIRKGKRMMKSIKLVGFILFALLVSIIPAVVVIFRGLSTRTELLILFLFINSNSAINPIIYCIHIKELSKDLKTMLKIKLWF